MDVYKKYKYELNLTPSMVKHSFLNSRQLIFEVTSRCNLQCEYCGYGELYNTRRVNLSKNMTFSAPAKSHQQESPFLCKCFHKSGRSYRMKNRKTIFNREP